VTNLVPRDMNKAIELYNKAAEQGLAIKRRAIGDVEIQAIANILKVNNTLTELNLSGL
jgi:TPR repeat protein